MTGWLRHALPELRMWGCWRQARGKFGLRTRAVRVHEATFIPEAEQQLLSTALAAWQRAAEGPVAASALGVSVARRRLLHAASRRAPARSTPACAWGNTAMFSGDDAGHA